MGCANVSRPTDGGLRADTHPAGELTLFFGVFYLEF